MPRAMKDSGIDWLGDIPADWECVKLGYIYSFSSGEALTAQDFVDDGNYDVYGANGKRGRYTKSNVHGKHILIGRVGALCGNIHLIDDDIWVTEHALISKKLNDSVIDDYAARLLLSMNLRQYASGTAQPVIASENIRKLKVPFPPPDEQQRIATFLDGECARIDSVIEKTRASVEEYKKLKQTLITRAVTKGIRPNRPMKQSGVEWLGDIPDGWDCRKLKTFSDVISKGATPKDSVNEINDDHCIRYIKSENIVDNRLIDKPEFGIRLDTHEEELKRSQLSERDILFVIAGASIGKTAIMRQELVPSNTNQATSFIRIKAKYIQSQKFIWYALQSDIVKKYISLYAVQSAQPNLSMADLGDMKIPIPPLEEQKEIAQYLDEKTAAIDSLVAKKNRLAEELTSLKKSLIFEYVTGKKEVPT